MKGANSVSSSDKIHEPVESHDRDLADTYEGENKNVLLGYRIQSYKRRYVVQATIYSLWRERNGRRQGAYPILLAHLSELLDSIFLFFFDQRIAYFLFSYILYLSVKNRVVFRKAFFI